MYGHPITAIEVKVRSPDLTSKMVSTNPQQPWSQGKSPLSMHSDMQQQRNESDFVGSVPAITYSGEFCKVVPTWETI